jgi:hypothetical protein
LTPAQTGQCQAPLVVLDTLEPAERIASYDVIAEPDRLSRLSLAVLTAGR